MSDDTDKPAVKSQALMQFDDSPDRFRNQRPEQNFSGASGVLFEQAMAQTRMAICLADPRTEDMPIVFANRAFTELTGYTQEDVIGRNCRFLQGPGTDPNAVAQVRKALADEDVIVVELLNYRKGGESFWNALHLGPIYDETGELIYYFGSQWDVTDVHAARADERHARMLARELSHRMKNMFAVIAGLVTVTGRTRGVPKEAAEITDRIRALGRAFETTLDQSPRGRVDLAAAIRAVLSPYDPEGDRIRFDGPRMRVHPNLVSAVGLALHELTTNAIKHGALSNETGHVTVSWHEASDGGLALRWVESGGPKITTDPVSQGAGTGIIDTLISTMGGSMSRDWRETGLRARIDTPGMPAE